jgi:DNA-3-methyladenine glycosylase II
MRRYTTNTEVLGPWSMATSRQFWEGFTPNALTEQAPVDQLCAVFRVEADWSRAQVRVSQHDDTAHIVLSGDGDLDAAVRQVCRCLSLDIDARGWPDVARRDPVIADARQQLPGLRPCGFYSPTKQPPGRCCPNESASPRPPGYAPT